MLISCKVSYSALVFSERQGAQLEAFFEKQDHPVEFLKDPSYWLPIEQLENFLFELSKHLEVSDAEKYYREVGHNNFELRAWGVLDSVLKMVESPQDIFSQPERFLSYFISPHPQVKILRHQIGEIDFEMSIGETEFPLVTSYLIGAVEGLPSYMSLPLAKIERRGLVWSLQWTDEQESLFDDKEKQRRQFNPEMVKSVMESLQEHQQSIEQKNRDSIPVEASVEAFDLHKKIQEEVDKRVAHWDEQQKLFVETLFKVKNDFYKLYDYFTRAQQLVTLISGSAKKASVKEAMRRVDWPYVQKEFPQMIESACDSILSLKSSINNLDNLQKTEPKEEKRQSIDLNQFIDELIEELILGPRQLKIDKHWLLDKKIAVDPTSFRRALKDILDTSIAKSKSGDEVRVVTRPNGRKVEIEITDTGQGFDEETLLEVFSGEGEVDLANTRQIIREHDGNISISSRSGEGATFLIELPMH